MTAWRTVRLASLALLLASTPGLAQVTCPGGASTWNDGAGTWNVAGNWTPVGVPAAGADVCFTTANANPTLPLSTTTVGTLNLLSGANLTLNGGLLRRFAINGGINADGIFTFNSNIVAIQPTASQSWVLNGSGNTFNAPLAPAASTTISVTGAGDLTFNSTAPGGFAGFNFGASLLVLSSNGLGSGTPITLTGVGSALVISSATGLTLDNPVTASASGQLLGVDGSSGVRHGLGPLTISPGVTLEELLASGNTVQLQIAGLTLGAGSTLLKLSLIHI